MKKISQSGIIFQFHKNTNIITYKTHKLLFSESKYSKLKYKINLNGQIFKKGISCNIFLVIFLSWNLFLWYSRVYKMYLGKSELKKYGSIIIYYSYMFIYSGKYMLLIYFPEYNYSNYISALYIFAHKKKKY